MSPNFDKFGDTLFSCEYKLSILICSIGISEFLSINVIILAISISVVYKSINGTFCFNLYVRQNNSQYLLFFFEVNIFFNKLFEMLLNSLLHFIPSFF